MSWWETLHLVTWWKRLGISAIKTGQDAPSWIWCTERLSFFGGGQIVLQRFVHVRCHFQPLPTKLVFAYFDRGSYDFFTVEPWNWINTPHIDTRIPAGMSQELSKWFFWSGSYDIYIYIMDIYHIDLPSEILQSLDVYTGSPKKKIQETEIICRNPWDTTGQINPWWIVDWNKCLGARLSTITLPETNIAPRNRWLEYYFAIGEASFRGYVSFRAGNSMASWWFQPVWKIVVKLDHVPK